MQISAGRSVDTNGTSPLEKNPRQDMTQELFPRLGCRFLPPAALVWLAEQLGGGERDFLCLHTLGRDGLQRVASAEPVLKLGGGVWVGVGGAGWLGTTGRTKHIYYHAVRVQGA